jgi:hypothetical protein
VDISPPLIFLPATYTFNGGNKEDTMSALLLILALGGSPSSAADLRREVHDALRHWARPGDQQLTEAARELLELYRRVDRDTQLAAASRKELRLKLRSRLAGLAERIAARSVVIPADRSKPLAQQIGGVPAGSQATGVAAPDAGQDMVDLIQKTIAPHTWDVNGGPGVIRFWRPGLALVVYQTGEVHAQIADLAGQLQKAGE